MKTFAIAVLLLVAAVFTCGCSEPRVPAPKNVSVPAGTPITIAEYEAEIKAAQLSAERTQKAEEELALRSIRKIERETKAANEQTIAAAQDMIDDLAASVKESAAVRQSSLQMLEVSFKQAQADIAARESFISNAFGAVNQVASSGLIPGSQLIVPFLGVAATLFGINRNAAAKRARADHESHVDAIDHAADVNPELKALLEKAKPLMAEWQTASSRKAVAQYTAGA